MGEHLIIFIGNDVTDNCNFQKNVTFSQIVWYQEQMQLERFSAPRNTLIY